MIADALAYIAAYRRLTPAMGAAVDFLTDSKTISLEPGRYSIDGDRVYAIAMAYTSKSPAETFWEAHRRYIDVQFVVAGQEKMLFAPRELMQAISDYDPEKDFTKYAGTGQSLIVPAGHFAIFWPHDVHMPSLAVDEPAPVRKIVVKVAVD